MHFVTALLTTGRNNVKSCDNGIKDDNEADVDCGDECFELCEIGMKCKNDFDCSSWKCNLETNRCIEDRKTIRFLSSSGASGGAQTTTAAPTTAAQTTTSGSESGADSTAPVVLSAEVTYDEPKIVLITYDESLEEKYSGDFDLSNWYVTYDPDPNDLMSNWNSVYKNPISISVSSDTVKLTFDFILLGGESIKTGYTRDAKNSSKNIADAAGNEVASYNSTDGTNDPQKVTNNAPPASIAVSDILPWSEIDVVGTKPIARYDHSATYYNDKMYIYGGRNDVRIVPLTTC